MGVSQIFHDFFFFFFIDCNIEYWAIKKLRNVILCRVHYGLLMFSRESTSRTQARWFNLTFLREFSCPRIGEILSATWSLARIYFQWSILQKEFVIAPVGHENSRGARVWRAGQGWIWRLVPCRGGAKVTPADQYRRRSSASIAFEPSTFSYFVSKSNAVWSRPVRGGYFQTNLSSAA